MFGADGFHQFLYAERDVAKADVIGSENVLLLQRLLNTMPDQGCPVAAAAVSDQYFPQVESDLGVLSADGFIGDGDVAGAIAADAVLSFLLHFALETDRIIPCQSDLENRKSVGVRVRLGSAYQRQKVQ
jgi:hypothetical protein